MNIQNAAGALLIMLPLAFNLFFFLLARRFDYPNILRSPTADVLNRFQAGGVSLKLLWYGFMLTAVLLAPLAVLLGQVLGRDGLAIVPTATVVGVLAPSCSSSGLPAGPSCTRLGATVRQSRINRGDARGDNCCLRVVPHLPRRGDR
jgi:hypothetical protein